MKKGGRGVVLIKFSVTLHHYFCIIIYFLLFYFIFLSIILLLWLLGFVDLCENQS